MAPVVLQQLITTGVNFMDNLMIGGLGEASISAASFGNQFYSLFQFICMGLGSGAVVLSAQLWGKKDLDAMRRVAAIALRLSIALCAAFTLFSVAFPRLIMLAFTHDQAVVAVGTPYMRLIGLTFLLAGLSSTCTYLLRSVGKVSVPLIGSGAAFFLNIFFNWVFIFGKLGAPKLDLVGAAVGTIIARVVEFCLVFGYFMWKDDRFRFRLKHLLLSGGELWRTYFKYGLPVLISDTLLGISLALISVILGHLGAAVSAANAIVNSVINLVSVVNAGMGGASAIVIGNTIGEGDIPRARREGNTYMLLSLLMGLVLIVPLLLLEGPYFSAYSIAEETRELAHKMMIIICCMLPLQTNAYVSSKGVLRGGGDTRFILAADSTLVWVFGLPVAALAGFVFHCDPIVPFIILRLEYPLKGIVCLIRFLSGKWIKDISAPKPAKQTRT
ncbi:MAG: MATE family efflux transporter [Oscillospiraceae bacterium]